MTLVDLGTLGGDDGLSGANDINDQGDVVGWSWDITQRSRPIIHLNWQMYFLNPAEVPPVHAEATSINNTGISIVRRVTVNVGVRDGTTTLVNCSAMVPGSAATCLLMNRVTIGPAMIERGKPRMSE